jgi:hypothetical protein
MMWLYEVEKSGLSGIIPKNESKEPHRKFSDSLAKKFPTFFNL